MSGSTELQSGVNFRSTLLRAGAKLLDRNGGVAGYNRNGFAFGLRFR